MELNQEEFAKKLDVNHSYVSRIESGEKQPSQKFIEKIEKVFDIPSPLILLLSSEESDLKGITKKDAEDFGSIFLKLIREL